MTSDNTTPLPERVALAYSKLSAVATDLNKASDELGTIITQIDTALKKLNLGVTVWITIAKRPAHPEDNDFWCETDQLGYAKLGGKWGIAIRSVGENISYSENSETGEWLFNDAPRTLRLQAIDNIEELLDGLAQVAIKTKEEIYGRLKDAQEVANAVTIASRGRVPLRGIPPPPKVGEGGVK